MSCCEVENVQSDPNQSQSNLESSAPILSRSPLFEFITRQNKEENSEEERFQSKINPYRKSENSFFEMVGGQQKPKKKPSHAAQN